MAMGTGTATATATATAEIYSSQVFNLSFFVLAALNRVRNDLFFFFFWTGRSAPCSVQCAAPAHSR